MERPVLTFAIVILMIAMGSAAVAGAYAQGGAAGQAASRDGTPPWLSPVQALDAAGGKAFTTSVPGRRGTEVAPLSLSSAANFEPGDTIKVCLDGAPCNSPVYRVIRSISGTDLVLDSPVNITAPATPVLEAMSRLGPG